MATLVFTLLVHAAGHFIGRSEPWLPTPRSIVPWQEFSADVHIFPQWIAVCSDLAGLFRVCIWSKLSAQVNELWWMWHGDFLPLSDRFPAASRRMCSLCGSLNFMQAEGNNTHMFALQDISFQCRTQVRWLHLASSLMRCCYIVLLQSVADDVMAKASFVAAILQPVLTGS